jgi:hypothetical protein
MTVLFPISAVMFPATALIPGPITSVVFIAPIGTFAFMVTVMPAASATTLLCITCFVLSGFDKIYRVVACTIFTAMFAPVARVPWRNMQIHRFHCYSPGLAHDDPWLRV